MDNSEPQGFYIKIQIGAETFGVKVWHSSEGFELEIEEGSGRRARYCWAGGRLVSREVVAKRVRLIESLRWTVEEPVYETVSQETEHVGFEAVERFLQYERDAQADQG